VQVQSLIALLLFWRMLSITKGLSDHLQSKNINMAKAADLVTASIETLQEFCSNEECDKLCKYVNNVVKLHDSNEAPPRAHRQRHLPSRLSAEAYMVETTGFRETMTASNDYKICLYYAVLDTVAENQLY